MICPAGVKIAELNARARAQLVASGKISWRLRLRNNLIARTDLVGKMGHPLAPVANALLANRLVRWLAEATLAIAKEAPFPPFARQRFTGWLRQHARPVSPTGRVVYFHGCSTEYYEPWVGQAALRVLEHNGLEVIVPPQNCCGLPLLSNGEFDAAGSCHRNNVGRLVDYARQGYAIVGTSTSCTLTLKEEAAELLDMTDADTRLVAEHTFDICEFLLTLLEQGRLNMDFQPLPLQLTYHQPCQYRAHRLGRPAVELLNLIPGLRLIESQAACCGMAGTYGYKQEKYAIAMAVGAPLFEFVRQVNAPLAVCDSETCRWQIRHGTAIPAIHPVELLAAAYGLPVEGALGTLLPTSP
jgi:glycerol-3-phosphate dehydrogenase subunit C